MSGTPQRRSLEFPDVTRPGVGAIEISPIFAGSVERQGEAADALLGVREREPLPEGFISLSVFASTDGEALLSYAQWINDDEARRSHAREHPTAGPQDAPDPVRYRVYRSLDGSDGSGTPGCLVTATFDTDGPERQRHFTDALIAARPRAAHTPGALGAHFHLSTDGTRVLLYTLWTSEQAHSEAAGSGAHDTEHELFSNTPGVRPTYGRRYGLLGTVAR